MMLKRLLPAAAVLLALAGAGAHAADPIKIGFMAPLTGAGASDGNSAKIGAEIAVEEINRAGGIAGRPLELVVYDDQANPAQAVPIANKLIGQDQVVAAVSGSYSAPTRAAAGVYQEAKVPFISAYALHPDITKTGDYVFRTALMGEAQGRAGAKLVGELLGKKKVVLITLQNDFGQALAAGFKSAAQRFGVEIVGEYEYSIKDRQFGPLVAKVASDKPDAVYASGLFFTAGPLVGQLRSGGVQATIIGQEGYDSEQFLKIAGAAAEGVIITTALDRDSSSPVTQRFIADFAKKAGFQPDMVGASANTAVSVLAAALKEAGPDDRARLRDAIGKVEIPAAVGAIAFTPEREARKAVQVQVVKNGAWHHYAVIDDAELLKP